MAGTPPPAPYSLAWALTPAYPAGIVLTWVNGTTYDYVTIERSSTGPTGTFSAVYTSSGTLPTTWTDTTATAGVQYYYRIFGWLAIAGASAYSNFPGPSSFGVTYYGSGGVWVPVIIYYGSGGVWVPVLPYYGSSGSWVEA